MNGCFDFARFQRGSEQFFVDLALEPKNVEILLDKVKCMEKIKLLVDGVYMLEMISVPRTD